MSQPLTIIADRQILLAEEIFSRFGRVELIDGRFLDKSTVKNADVLLVRSVTKVDFSLLKNSKIEFERNKAVLIILTRIILKKIILFLPILQVVMLVRLQKS